MLVRKFYAPTSREALRLVKEALGDDALILSNRRAAEGIEISAVASGEVESVMVKAGPVGRPASAAHPPVIRADPRFAKPPHVIERQKVAAPVSHAFAAPPLVPMAAPSAAAQVPAALRDPASPRQQPSPMIAKNPIVVPPAPDKTPASEPAVKPESLDESAPTYALVHEVRLLRSLVEGQLAALAWNDLKRRDPAKSETMRQLIAGGFGASLSREVVDELPDGLDLGRAIRMLKLKLQQRLVVASPETNLVEGGGILALVGPTGVGKTTTVAKLAAECALKHGASRLALVTTDTYRIGAVDQLRIYGKIIGVPVYAIRSEADLRTTLDDLSSRHLVLIDTVGMSQRDRRLADQVGLLSGATRRVRRVLLLSAVSHLNVLEDVVKAYRGPDLAGCILTKIDEALTMGGALDALMRHKLSLHYVTNGQRVPEDLHKPNALYLIERAFRDTSQIPPLSDGDLPFTLAAGQN